MNQPFLGFSSESFERRRSLVVERLADGALVLPSAPVLHRSRDTEIRYRPDSELFYLTGAVEPGMVAILRGGSEDPFLLFVPERDPSQEIWSGPRLSPEEARERYGAHEVYPLHSMDQELPRLLRPSRQVFFRLGVNPRVERLVVEALRWARSKGVREGVGPRSVMDPGTILDDLRLIKDPEEVAEIRRAAALTVSAFREALGRLRPEMGEWEVEALLESGFRRRGARGPAFPTIVGSGVNGCTLHYTDNASRIGQEELVLVDGGAETRLYCADVTRTVPAGGVFRPLQLEIYQAVFHAHQAAVSRVRPGATVGEVHRAALEVLCGFLVELGILEGDPEELLAKKAVEAYFPHRTSHWLGLDVHDVGDYASQTDGSRVLMEGMALTVEPGLYFPPEEGASSPYEGIGVRLEDDLVVTAEGAEVLTAQLPIEPSDVEEWIASGGEG